MDSAMISLAQLNQLLPETFYVTVNGKCVDWKTLSSEQHFQVHFRLRGGKGGFGSLLRSFRIHRSTNQLMCRDLTGRRLADVKEEEKLRKWIENAEEREEQKRRQKQEKYEKLKAGAPKHEFHDPKFISTREKILDETDDAFEAGISASKKKKDSDQKEPNKTVEADKILDVDDDNDSDDLGHSVPGISGISRKRKSVVESEQLKKSKIETSVDSSEQSTEDAVVDCETKIDMISPVSKVENIGNSSTPKLAVETTQIARAEEGKNLQEEPKETSFDDITLDEFESAESLHPLGLERLKYALSVRGLKCGGTLAERASRLFLVKNLKPDQYPKAICAKIKK